MNFEYFLEHNKYNVIIENRGGPRKQYAVWHDQCVIDDCLDKKSALSIARHVLKELTEKEIE